MRKKFQFLFWVTITTLLMLTACNASSTDAPARVVEAYWQAFASKDANQLSGLICSDYEATALNNLNSFQSVETILKDLSCMTTVLDGDTAEVTCVGALSVSYGAEVTDFDLSASTYLLIRQGGDWLMCGEK